ncbi:MAG: PA14 domain-containing protein, partial [Chloroflexota bacterium]|nr:PA14 domain-containing protein [Chloroflexota bacterium]
MPGFARGSNITTVKAQRAKLPKNDPRGTRKGRPLAFIYDLTATNKSKNTRIHQFDKSVVLIWNLDRAALEAEGVSGWPVYAYSYDESKKQWEEIPSEYDPRTGQLIAVTDHFSLKAIGDGFDKVNNYLPTVNDFEVDIQSGTSSVEYPIELPAGPGGLQPQVNLSYNSGNGDRVDNNQQGPSPIGWGWTLSSSYIVAVQHEYTTTNPPYRPWTVSLAMAGAHGDLVKGTDGYWHTANESFAKVLYHPNPSAPTQDWWEAWTKDGTRYTFNIVAIMPDIYDNNARKSYKWLLSKIEDPKGNTISYGYKHQDGGDTLTNICAPGTLCPLVPLSGTPQVSSTPVSTTNKTRATYPYQITYGTAGTGGDKVLVQFRVVDRGISGYNDLSSADTQDDDAAYQAFRVDKIEVFRKQETLPTFEAPTCDTATKFCLLRAYDLVQGYDIELKTGNVRDPDTDEIIGITTQRHLTLKGITPRGNGSNRNEPTNTNLPGNTFVYYSAQQSVPPEDWGHLYQARNGYGGEVRFYYDRAGGDVHKTYRRVRAKRILDGLDPAWTPTAGTQSTSHNALYKYDYRGAGDNRPHLSADAGPTFTEPLHRLSTQFRGFAWVREEDPTGQVTDHYFNQGDSLRSMQWRAQVGKHETDSSNMNDAPAGNSEWVVEGSVSRVTEPGLTPGPNANQVWRLAVTPTTQPTAAVQRSVAVRDGADVHVRFRLDGPADEEDSDFKARWVLKSTVNNSDYWGIEVYRVDSVDENQNEIFVYQARAIWSLNGTAESRELTSINNTLVPRLKRALSPNDWYWVRLHTSPDGRFFAELHLDDYDQDYNQYDGRLPSLFSEYVGIKSGDSKLPRFAGDSVVIPSFPTGHTWVFRHTLASDGSHRTLIDDLSEVRTVYNQGDQVYSVRSIATAAPTRGTAAGAGNNTQGMRIEFVELTQKLLTIYGAECCQLGQVSQNKIEYAYDNNGNTTMVKEYGSLDYSGDDRTTVTEFVEAIYPVGANGVQLSRHIVNLPKRVRIFQGLSNPSGSTGTLKAETHYFYDDRTDAYGAVASNGRGLLTWAKNVWVENGTADPTRWTGLRYGFDTTFGNQVFVKDANNNTTTTEYDLYYHSFPITVTLANTSKTITHFDYTLDRPSTTTDANGMKTEIRYDSFGRIRRSWVVGSGNVNYGTNADPNDRYEYTDYLPVANPTATVSPPFSIRYEVRLDNTATGTFTKTWQVRWFDGIGRPIQEVGRKDDSTLTVVDTTYTVRGEIESASLPYAATNPSTNTYPTSYITPNTTKPRITMTYDGLGRPVYVWNPDGSYTLTEYNWLLRIDKLDEELHRHIKVSDQYGRLLLASDVDPQANPTDITTVYGYDALDNLIESQRINGTAPVINTYQYDGFGRKKAMDDQDAGKWQYEYDSVGNLRVQRDAIFLSDPNAASNSITATHQVFFTYDSMNRIKAKYYGAAHFNDTNSDGIPEGTPDVRYYYDNELNTPGNDDASATKSWGRLRKAEVTGYYDSQTANSHLYEYDPRGLLKKEQITSTLAGRTYEVEYSYDLAGRLKTIIYPDPESEREIATFSYNKQAMGLPVQLHSSETGGVFPVFDAQYNARAQLTELKQGTSSSATDLLTTVYTYDDLLTTVPSKRGWLARTEVKAGATGATTTILDSTMTYYKNGNISTLNQLSSVDSSPTFTNTFLYNARDQLISATNSAGLWASETYAFDALNRMTTRTIGGTTYNYSYYDHTLIENANKPVDAPYAYGNNTYSYDANGDQVSKTSNGSTQTRTFDPEGRLQKLVEGGITTTFIYDANGQRLIKMQSTPVPSITPTSTPTALVTPTSPPTNGLRGEYYNNQDFSSLKLIRYDGPIDFNFGTGSPDPSIHPDSFSVRWTGLVQTSFSGEYTFYVTSDDGVRLWVNEEKIIDDLAVPAPKESSATVFLSGNKKYSIRLEYQEATAGASVKLEWQQPDFTMTYPCDPSECTQQTTRGVIPLGVLFPDTTNSHGLYAEYFDNMDLTNLKVARYDAQITFDWGSGSPDPNIAADTFSARWRGKVVAPATGTYTFYTYSDDGVRVWVNGQQVINNWTNHAPTENSGQITLSAGQQYYITVEYFENGGSCLLHLSWTPPGGTKQVIQWDSLIPDPTAPLSVAGLYGEYYDNADLTNLKITRYNTQVSFDWVHGSPDASIGADTFSVRWRGKVQATTSGTYTFYTESDDGVRLWVDGQLLVNNWTNHAPTENSGQITLSAGQQYDILLEYFEGGGTCLIHLKWTPPGGTKQIIPASQLFPPDAGGSGMRTLYIGNLYEEDITPGHGRAYTSYYTLGSKTVGMRKVEGSTSKHYRLVGDHLGSTTLIVDTALEPGASPARSRVVQRTFYKPYGEVAWTSGSTSDPTRFTSVGYTGQRLDKEIGLMYYGARFYDPALSLFISADPTVPDAGNPIDYNRYLYTRGNPVRYTDPLGYGPEDYYIFVEGCVLGTGACVRDEASDWGEYNDTLRRMYNSQFWGLRYDGNGNIYWEDYETWAKKHVITVPAPDPTNGADNIWAAIQGITDRGPGVDIHILGHSAGGGAVAQYLIDAATDPNRYDPRVKSAVIVDAPIGHGFYRGISVEEFRKASQTL